MYDRRAVLTPRGVLAIEMKAERRVTLVLCLMMVAAVSAGPAAATASGLGSSPTPEKTVFQKAGVVLPHGSPGEADSVYARAPFVLRDDDGTYKMWYSGYDGSVNRMLYASSPDGIRWTKHGVILDVGVPPYNWNSVGGQSVLKIQSVYHMWFSAGYWSGGPFVYWAQISHAVSMDGLYWNVTGVVLPPNQFWDRGMTNSPWVVRDSAGLFWLFHSGWDGSNTRIGVATSGDGISFTPYAGNPILDLGPSGSWDQSDVNTPSVIPGSTWLLYYGGTDRMSGALGTATSSDGLHWSKSPGNPEAAPVRPLHSAPVWCCSRTCPPTPRGPPLSSWGEEGTTPQ